MSGAAQAGEDWAERTLRALGGGDSADRLDLAEAALALASFDAPADRLDGYRDHLRQMADEVGAAAGAAEEPEPRLAALTHVLFGLHGYAGDDETYDDLQNANLIRVIDRRKGLPVALGILMIHLARAQGWEMDGLDFPGHFLLRFDAAGERRIVDPFHAGATLDAPALRALLKATSGADAELDGRHYEPVSDRDILLRLQNNIKLRLIRDRRVEEALGIVERMLMVAPDRGPLWREAGLMSAHIGHFRSAISALETYVAKAPADTARLEAEGLIRELRGRLT